MHTLITPSVAQEIVNDRIRAAQVTRRARLFSRRTVTRNATRLEHSDLIDGI